MIKQIHTLGLYDYLNVNPLARMCVQSWEKFGNGAEIKIWTENDAFIHDKMQNSTFCQNIIQNPNMSEAQKKIEICDYLKNCIMFEFGGLFIDADTELLSEVDFSSSFYLNYPSTSALCVPFYIDHVNDSIFSDVIAKYDRIEESKTATGICDAEMARIEDLSKESQEKLKMFSDRGLSLGILINHWSTIAKAGHKQYMCFGRAIDRFIYIPTQEKFDNFLRKEIFNYMFWFRYTFSFVFIPEDIVSPFLTAPAIMLRIIKSSKETRDIYLKRYLKEDTDLLESL